MIAHEKMQEFPRESRSGPYRSSNCQPTLSERNRLLFMDDEKIVRDVVSAILGSAGFRVTTAETGEETLDAFRKARDANDPFYVVLLDLNVPGSLDGKETAQLLREIDPGVSIILVTGSTNDPVFTEFFSYGFQYALAKPFTSQQLIQAVTACFVKSAPQDAVSPSLRHQDLGR